MNGNRRYICHGEGLLGAIAPEGGTSAHPDFVAAVQQDSVKQAIEEG